MHAISSYRGNRPTRPQTHKQTGLTTIQCVAASAQSNDLFWLSSLTKNVGLCEEQTVGERMKLEGSSEGLIH